MIEQEGLANFMVTSGYGANTNQPYVQMLIEAADWSTQMSPATARSLAFNLLACADAAESDGFLVTWLRQRIGVEDQSALAGVLVQFREYRDAQRKGGEGDGGS